MKVIPPHKSIDITKGKKYHVIKDYGFGDVEIKNDAGEVIPVCTEKSAWTFQQSWKVLKEKGDKS